MPDGLDTVFSELVILKWSELNIVYLHTKAYKYITDYFMYK